MKALKIVLYLCVLFFSICTILFGVALCLISSSQAAPHGYSAGAVVYVTSIAVGMILVGMSIFIIGVYWGLRILLRPQGKCKPPRSITASLKSFLDLFLQCLAWCGGGLFLLGIFYVPIMGSSYEVRGISFADIKTEAYRVVFSGIMLALAALLLRYILFRVIWKLRPNPGG